MTTALARKTFGSAHERRVRSVAEIAALENDLEKLGDEELRVRTEQFKKEFAAGKDLDALRQRPEPKRQET